jgi:hypothetical protein
LSGPAVIEVSRTTIEKGPWFSTDVEQAHDQDSGE